MAARKGKKKGVGEGGTSSYRRGYIMTLLYFSEIYLCMISYSYICDKQTYKQTKTLSENRGSSKLCHKWYIG